MQQSRDVPGIDKVLVASGIRMDLAQQSPEYMEELAKHHVGGHLKVAPEHTDPDVLSADEEARRSTISVASPRLSRRPAQKAGKKQYLVPYFIASHPGSDLNAMIDLAVFLSATATSPTRCRTSSPRRLNIATCMYYTGIDPFTGKEVYTARNLRDRKLQRALMQFFKPENYFMVREALLKAGRGDLIGNGCDCLIPARPPKAAIEARRRNANEVAEGDHYHTMANPASGAAVGERGLPNQGYRPGRSTAASSGQERERKARRWLTAMSHDAICDLRIRVHDARINISCHLEISLVVLQKIRVYFIGLAVSAKAQHQLAKRNASQTSEVSVKTMRRTFRAESRLEAIPPPHRPPEVWGTQSGATQ